MSETKHKRSLREKETARILDELSQRMKVNNKELFETKHILGEMTETSTAKIFFINGKPITANFKEVLLPTLVFEKALQLLPKITVNMGAVPYICNGADLMAPGIVKIEGNFNTNDYVLIVDERHQKPLAIAIALTDSQTARGLKHGKVAKNMHYVGDSLWNQLKGT